MIITLLISGRNMDVLIWQRCAKPHTSFQIMHYVVALSS
jgi:hypothetical protein